MKVAEVRAALGDQADIVLHKLHLAGLIVVSEAEHSLAVRKAAAYDRLQAADADGG